MINTSYAVSGIFPFVFFQSPAKVRGAAVEATAVRE